MKRKALHPKDSHWIPLSDLMTGLMMFFLLVSVAYMLKVESESSKIRQIAVSYDVLKSDLYDDLASEFKNDLGRWGAELDRDLAVRFKEPEIQFDTGSDVLKPKFKEILNDFFPRYYSIISSDKYRTSIQEIRIEGHTSSIWTKETAIDNAYFLNMELSQKRTRSVLSYIFNIESVTQDKDWLKKKLTANGLSSSKPIQNEQGEEDAALSQRVEFRVRTNAEEQISNILKTAANEAH